MNPETSEIISVQNLTKFYGKARGVEDITFSVYQGEIFGFLGPNGAGKTTTIRMLLDLLRATSGDIRIFGKAISGNSKEIRDKIGYLPGNFNTYGSMTGEDFLSFAAQMEKAEPKLKDELIERFQVSEKDLLKKTKHLSKGNLQKLGIIQAFYHDPELLILDEPTSGLDPLMQEEFYKLLREVRDKGRTVFFSSHNLPEVEKVCRRIGIIKEGNLVALETLEELKKKKVKRLKFVLKKPVDNIHLPAAELVREDGMRYEFLVKGEPADILKKLSELPIADITFPEPDLETVFLAYYREGGGK